MPIEYIQTAYMDETVYDEIIEETLEKKFIEGEARYVRRSKEKFRKAN